MLAQDELSHPLSYGAFWNDPATDIDIPKEQEKNRLWRQRILNKCNTNVAYRSKVMAACRKSFYFWVNLCGFTYHVFEVIDGEQRPVPSSQSDAQFITWPVQDAAAAKIFECMTTGRDVCIDKSRDMGASWLVLAMFLWLWTFRPNTPLLVVSRIEDYVDMAGNPDCLFWKIDFMLKRMKSWMQPKFRRSRMLLENKDNGSVIGGEATSQNVGRGGRRYAILIDEAAAIPHLGEIIMATANSTSCRIYVSTPKGPGAYSDVRFSGIDVFVLGYWDHPDKGVGRTLKHHARFNRTLWWTPYFEHQETVRRRSLRDLAQNELCDHQTSGTMVFDAAVINLQLSTYASKPPFHVGNLIIEGDNHTDQRFSVGPNGGAKRLRWVEDPRRGRLRLWVPLVPDKDGNMRPRQDRVYAAGGDISWGQGASNSVGSFGDVEHKTKIAEWADANTSPQEFALIMAGLGRWFGGVRGCVFMSWESNGPGGPFSKSLRSLAYPWMDRHIPDGKATDTKTDTLGWLSSAQAKINILGELDGDMAADNFRNPSPEALKEAARYVFYETGGLGPASLEQESADATATHGDRVIADAVLNRAMKRCPRIQPTKPVIEWGTRAWRDKQHDEDDKPKELY